MISLRPALPQDADRLASLAADAFDAAFGHLYKPQDLASFMAEARTPDVYRAAIDHPDKRVELAEWDGALAAYSLTIRGEQFAEHPEPRPQNPLFLSQLYCSREYTGKGLGAALIEQVIADARQWGADAVTLSVYSENFGAQRFYQRYGFAKVADIGFWVGTHRDDEFLYELRL